MPIPLIDADGGMVNLHLSEVSCILKDDKTRKIKVGDGRDYYHVPSTINQLISILAPHGFFKIDKNKIINITKIDKYENGIITIGDFTYTVSRRNRKQLELEIKKYR